MGVAAVVKPQTLNPKPRSLCNKRTTAISKSGESLLKRKMTVTFPQKQHFQKKGLFSEQLFLKASVFEKGVSNARVFNAQNCYSHPLWALHPTSYILNPDPAPKPQAVTGGDAVFKAAVARAAPGKLQTLSTKP